MLTDDEKSILRIGLDFALPPQRLNYCNFLTQFELFYRQLKAERISCHSGHTKDFIKTKFKDIAMTSYRCYSRPSFLFFDEDLQIIKDLKKDTSIYIMKLDKGNGVVVIDRDDYTKKMKDILSDKDKFLQLDGDPTSLSIKRENKVKTFLRTLKKNGTISEPVYNKLFLFGSRLGILYGLPNVHKAGVPLRPILSSALALMLMLWPNFSSYSFIRSLQAIIG